MRARIRGPVAAAALALALLFASATPAMELRRVHHRDFRDVPDLLEGLGPPGVAMLIEALDDPRPHVRAAAADKLGHMWPAPREALAGVMRLLSDESDDVRLSAAYAARNLRGDSRAIVEALTPVLRNGTPTNRNVALNILSGAGPRIDLALEDVIAAALDPGLYPQTRAQAIHILQCLSADSDRAVEALGALLADTNPTVWFAAIDALKNSEMSDETRSNLVAGIRAPSARVRAGCCLALGPWFRFREEAIPHLRLALRDDNQSVRVAASATILNIRSAQILSVYVDPPELASRRGADASLREAYAEEVARRASHLVDVMATVPGAPCELAQQCLKRAVRSEPLAAALIGRLETDNDILRRRITGTLKANNAQGLDGARSALVATLSREDAVHLREVVEILLHGHAKLDDYEILVDAARRVGDPDLLHRATSLATCATAEAERQEPYEAARSVLSTKARVYLLAAALAFGVLVPALVVGKAVALLRKRKRAPRRAPLADMRAHAPAAERLVLSFMIAALGAVAAGVFTCGMLMHDFGPFSEGMWALWPGTSTFVRADMGLWMPSTIAMFMAWYLYVTCVPMVLAVLACLLLGPWWPRIVRAAAWPVAIACLYETYLALSQGTSVATTGWVGFWSNAQVVVFIAGIAACGVLTMRLARRPWRASTLLGALTLAAAALLVWDATRALGPALYGGELWSCSTLRALCVAVYAAGVAGVVRNATSGRVVTRASPRRRATAPAVGRR